jgi:predicted Zn-dependent peptidase
MSCQPENAASNRRAVVDVLSEVQRNGIREEELTVARTRLASRQVRAGERTFRRMLDIGRDWTYLAEYRTLDDELEAIDAVDAKTIRELLDHYPLTNLTTVALGPLDKLD